MNENPFFFNVEWISSVKSFWRSRLVEQFLLTRGLLTKMNSPYWRQKKTLDVAQLITSCRWNNWLHSGFLLSLLLLAELEWWLFMQCWQ